MRGRRLATPQESVLLRFVAFCAVCSQPQRGRPSPRQPHPRPDALVRHGAPAAESGGRDSAVTHRATAYRVFMLGGGHCETNEPRKQHHARRPDLSRARQILHPRGRPTRCLYTNTVANSAAKALNGCAESRTPTVAWNARIANLMKSSVCCRHSPPVDVPLLRLAGLLERASAAGRPPVRAINLINLQGFP